MISHRETRLVPYPAELMYAVVSDVEKYPEFLPWVLALRVHRLVDPITVTWDAGYGANDAKTYRVHDKLGTPCYVCGTPIARVDFEEHTIYYCPDCQTGGRVLKDRRMSRLLK